MADPENLRGSGEKGSRSLTGRSRYAKAGVAVLLLLISMAALMYGVSDSAIAVENQVTGLTVSPDPIRLGSSIYIQYSVGQEVFVNLTVYKDSGEHVRTLINNVKKIAGTYFQGWDGKDKNGILVPDGNYRFVVEAKDLTGSPAGSMEKNLVAGRYPGVSNISDSPDPFSPTNNGQSTISYTLSSNALVTVTIKNGYYPVRTLTASEPKAAGNHTVAWDGKDDLALIVPDATYSYQIEAVSPLVANFKTTSPQQYITVAKDAPQITEFTVTPDPLKISVSSMTVRYNLSEAAAVTLKVLDSSGTPVKTLLNGVSRNMGYNSTVWDGKVDNVSHIMEGSYSVVISAVDNSGLTSGEQAKLFTAGYQPDITDLSISPNPFNPNDPVNNQAAVSYRISNDARVTVQILNGYVPVRTLVNGLVQDAGVQTVQWDGRDDNGNIAGDGSYSCQVTSVSPTVATFRSTLKTGFTVEKGPPVITEFLLSPAPFKMGAGSLAIRYSLSENAAVSVAVYKGTELVREIVTAKSANAGYNTDTWDGKDKEGQPVSEGVYTIIVRAVDNAGNPGQISGNIACGYQPAISGVSHLPEPFDPAAGNAVFSFSLSSKAKVTFSILKGAMPIKTISAGILDAGAQSLTWDGKNDNGQLISDGTYTYQLDAVSPTVSTFFSRFQGNITVEGNAPALTDVTITPYIVKIGFPATIRYTLSEPATVTVEVLNPLNGNVVRSFPAEAKTTGGYYSLSWDTRDNLTGLITSGDYILKLSAVDNSQNTGSAQIAFQAGAVPVVSNPAAVPGNIDVGLGESTTITYTISEKSYVTAKVIDSTGIIRKTIFSYREVPAGPDLFTWDGLGSDGKAGNGTFTYTIDALSIIGNFKSVQASGNISVTGAAVIPPPANSCSGCHQGYPQAHPVTNCGGCHGNDEPLRDCAACHPTWTHDYKVLNNFDCAYCHNETYSYKVPGHPADIDGLHDVTTLAQDCRNCHNPSLSVEHPLHLDPAGQPYDCNTCHNSANTLVQQAIANEQKNCEACHTQSNHETLHTTTVLDSNCTTCHINSLTQEHLNNPTTQTDAVTGQVNPWTCDTCHASTNGVVSGAVATGNTQCAACHRQGHNISFVETVPSDIPLYSGFEWTTPIDAAIWNGESWMPEEFLTGGKVIISNRRAEVTCSDVWAFYSSEMGVRGWTLASGPPAAGADVFNVTFTKDTHKAVIWFYGGAGHTETPVLPAGYRIEVIYK